MGPVNFERYGVDVIKSFFAIFANFQRKKLAFFSRTIAMLKNSSSLSKKRQYFCQIFSAKIFQKSLHRPIGQQRQKGHDYYGQSSSWFSSKPSSSSYFDKRSSGGFGDLVILVIMAAVIYALYRTCLSGNDQQMGDRQYRCRFI
jgi:hypothetical protein